jgi:hypothetical protein
MPVTHCKGNVSFATNMPEATQKIIDWSWNGRKHYAPRWAGDIGDEDFRQVYVNICKKAASNRKALQCFVGEFLREVNEEGAPDLTLDEPETLDGPDSDDELLPEDIERLDAQEPELLEAVPLPGVPEGEANRRRQWLKIPRRARAAIRKMHSEWGHLPNKALKTILKMSKSSKELLDAVDHLRCEHCVISAKPTQTAKVGPPKPYIFNHEVGIDVVDIHDVQGNPF